MGKENRKIIIGIVAKHIRTDKIRTDALIKDEVKQAIIDNGSVAIGIIPVNREVQFEAKDWKKLISSEDKENIIEQIKLCDGIVIQGGT